MEPQGDFRELGYLLIENCTLCVLNQNESLFGNNIFGLGEWIPVHLDDRPQSPSKDERHTKYCSQCNLLLRVNEKGQYNSLVLSCGDINAFGGEVSGLIHKGCPSAKQRSDAALLMGALWSALDVITIQKISVRFLDQKLRRADLLVTVDFPFISASMGKRRRSVLDPSKRSMVPSKQLHPALQLVLAIVRSDWDTLGDFMLQPKTNQGNTRQHATSYFPPRLSLEELYNRVQGSSTYSQQRFRGKKLDSDVAESFTEASLLGLPVDVLSDRIATFLAPRSLNSLRQTCPYLHQALQSIVPGLRLNLYSHQISSLAWMRSRETRLLKEHDCLDVASSRGDLHRAITGGRSTLLRSRDGVLVIRIDSFTGYELLEEDLGELPRTVARGGLLCDEPGLGKSITVLSLILQTAGLTTMKGNASDAGKPQKISDNEIFQTYWKDQMTNDFRRPALLKLFNNFIRGEPSTQIWSMTYIKKYISEDKYAENFLDFVKDVKDSITQSFEGPCIEDMSNVTRLIHKFDDVVAAYTRSQLKVAKKFFSNAAAKPNSRLASILEQVSQHQLMSSLTPSHGSLLVIPAVLIEHWQTQINSHVNWGYCTDREPLIYEYGRNDNAMTVDEAMLLCRVHKTHSPIVFLDKSGTRALPSAEFLSMFQIVITTTQRFHHEYKNGSFQEELQKDKSGDYIPNSIDDRAYCRSPEACPLLKVHWLRMVVDEGHAMGKERANSTIIFASWISAERRWAITGTPTKQSTQIGQLRGLIRFLRHDFFTARLHGDMIWKTRIAKCWSNGYLASFYRLQSLLAYIMTRHTKLDIIELPPPIFSTAIIPMSFPEVVTYNTLVTAIQSNLLLTSMDGKTSGVQDSLLHRSQTKHARIALANVRRVCVGYTHVIPTLQHTFYLETVHLLNSHNIPEKRIFELKQFLHRAEDGMTTDCECCGLSLSTLLIFPCCGSLSCPECTDHSSRTCPICDKLYDVDDLQTLQPGFALEWLDNLKADAERRKQNLSRPKKLGPSSEGESIPRGNSSNVVQNESDIAIRPVDGQRRIKRKGDGHLCVYDDKSIDGYCKLCLEPHDSCNLLNDKGRCNICYRLAIECSRDESKAYYLTKTILKLYDENQTHLAARRGMICDDLDIFRPLKIIVFSQFREALNVIGTRLLDRFGSGRVAEYWGSFRKQELHRFTQDNSCFVMLLSKDGSEGLDLSLVTHIFFLEEIWDKSLEDQAVARAWRMGAKGQVRVETLLAKNTVEEMMREFESSEAREYVFGEEHDVSDLRQNVKEYQQAKLRSLLKSLRLMTDFHFFSKTSIVGPSNEHGTRTSTLNDAKGVVSDHGAESSRMDDQERAFSLKQYSFTPRLPSNELPSKRKVSFQMDNSGYISRKNIRVN